MKIRSLQAGDKDTAPPAVVPDETQPPKTNENIIVQPPESTSDAPTMQYVQPYANSQFYSPYYYYPNYQNYPWPYVPQQQYYTQPNAQGQQQTVYVQPQQPEYEGILVPIQPSVQPQRSQLPSSPTQTTQTQNTQLSSPSSSPSLPSAPVTQYAGVTASSTASTENIEQSKNPPQLTNRNSFDLALILQAILPQNIIQLIIVIGNFILNSFSTLAFAGAITSLLCSLTPVCTISFGGFPFGVRKLLVDGAEISTIQRVRRAAEMVTNALEKYEKIQKGVESLTNTLKQTQKKS